MLSKQAGRQRGLTMLGLLFWAVVIGLVAVVVVRTVPAIIEYSTIRKMVRSVASSGGNSVPEIRNAFEKQSQADYSSDVIRASDLQITKDANDQVIIHFKYDKEVELFGPVSLLIHFSGSSR